MAEPIRKPILPLHRRPNPGRRPRPPHPLHTASRAVHWPADENRAKPPLAPPRAAAPDLPETAPRPRTGTVAPGRERRLRTFLQIAIALHIAALLPFLLPSGTPPSVSDALLGTVVLLAGAGALTLGSTGRKHR